MCALAHIEGIDGDADALVTGSLYLVGDVLRRYDVLRRPSAWTVAEKAVE